MVVWIQNPFDNLPSEGCRRQRYWLMCEAFVRAGHRVVFWTSDFSHAKKERREEGRMEREEGIEVRFIPTLPYSKNVSFDRIRSHRAYAKEWLRLALDPHPSSPIPHPSLVITSTPTISGAEAALKIGRELGAKVVIDVQDAWPETFERLAPRGLRWLARLVSTPLRMKVQRIYREADLVTGVCERYRELTGREDYYRAYLGIELKGKTVGERERKGVAGVNKSVRLVYSGNLGRTYDLGTVVKAVEANSDFELDVAGFGSFTCDCPRVRFHGLLSGRDLQTLLEQCDVGIVPMRPESWVGVPNKLFDYSAAGLAIVSSLGGESSALLGQYRCGVTYNAGDAASLTAAVRKAMLFGRDASRTMCEAEFDAVRIYDDYVSRVSQIVQEHPKSV